MYVGGIPEIDEIEKQIQMLRAKQRCILKDAVIAREYTLRIDTQFIFVNLKKDLYPRKQIETAERHNDYFNNDNYHYYCGEELNVSIDDVKNKMEEKIKQVIEYKKDNICKLEKEFEKFKKLSLDEIIEKRMRD